jgi:hypothetical protein
MGLDTGLVIYEYGGPPEQQTWAQSVSNTNLKKLTIWGSQVKLRVNTSFARALSHQTPSRLPFRNIPQTLLQSPGSLLARNLNLRWSRPGPRRQRRARSRTV